MPGTLSRPARKQVPHKHSHRKQNAASLVGRPIRQLLLVGAIVARTSVSHLGSCAAFSSSSVTPFKSMSRSQRLFQPCPSMSCAIIGTRRRAISTTSSLLAQAPRSTDHVVSSEGDSNSSSSNRGLFLPSHPDLCIRSVMAPMVAASDYPFRYFLRKYCGVDLTYTQMLHAKNLVDAPKFRSNHLDLFETGVKYPKLQPSQLRCLQGLPLPDMENYQEATSSPVIVQLAGHDAKVVVRAAKLIWEHTEGRLTGIDLNLGCPQSIARTGNYGAHLMERDFDQVCHILAELRKALPASTAVSAKIRLPESDVTLLERIPRLVDTGINFLTVHGRTIHENKTKVGPCHVDRIRLAVESAQRVVPNFPIVANGGMEDYEDIQQILQRTGAVAAMSSEALLETPILFQRSSSQLTPRERLNQQFSFARDYLHTCATVVPPVPGAHAGGGSVGVIRTHVFKFLHRYLQEQQDLRLQLVDGTTNILQAVALVDQLEARYLGLSNKELLDGFESSSPLSSWYRRHRHPDRRVHQKDVNLVSSFSPFPPPPPEGDGVEDRKKQILFRLAKMKQEKETKLLLNIAGTRLP